MDSLTTPSLDTVSDYSDPSLPIIFPCPTFHSSHDFPQDENEQWQSKKTPACLCEQSYYLNRAQRRGTFLPRLPAVTSWYRWRRRSGSPKKARRRCGVGPAAHATRSLSPPSPPGTSICESLLVVVSALLPRTQLLRFRSHVGSRILSSFLGSWTSPVSEDFQQLRFGSGRCVWSFDIGAEGRVTGDWHTVEVESQTKV